MAATQAFFISDPLFHLVLPNRVVEAIDTRRTTVLIKDEGSNGVYFRRVRFPDGIRFDNQLSRAFLPFRIWTRAAGTGRRT